MGKVEVAICRYAPWLAAVVCTAVIVATRLRTNYLLGSRFGPVPKVVSVFYMAGFIGLIGAFFWAIFSIAWWACLPVIGLYVLINLIFPSAVSEFVSMPAAAYLAATQQAVEELKDLPPGTDKSQRVMQRADEVMRSQGYRPRTK